MSLYQKYRPLGFTDVVGQDHIVTTLEEACRQDKLAHAYLFAGNRGTGKTSVARILSKSIMTDGIEDEKVRELIIKGIEEGNLVDLLEIDAASNRGIDDIRDLVEKIQFSPVVAKAKVYIIDEVHMLTKEAFNALLKTLEEPPAYAFFILATTELNKIPLTIQSRCQCFPFRNIRDEDIVRRLQYIADQERITVEREALRIISKHVQGGMRDAISLLDQLRSLESITAENVRNHMGSTGHEYVEAIRTALADSNKEQLLETVRTMEDNGIQLDVFVRQMLGEIREELHRSVAAGKPIDQQTHMTDVLLQALRDIRYAPVPGLVLEAALIRLCGSSAPATATAPKKEPTKERVEKDEPKPKNESSDAPSDKKATSDEEESEEKKENSSAIVEAPEANLSSLQGNWDAIVNETQPASVRMSLKNGEIVKVEDNTVVVSFTSAFHKDKVADTDASRSIEAVIEKIFKKQLKLQCELDTGMRNSSEKVSENQDVNLAEAASEIF